LSIAHYVFGEGWAMAASCHSPLTRNTVRQIILFLSSLVFVHVLRSDDKFWILTYWEFVNISKSGCFLFFCFVLFTNFFHI
jgi:hypothetical protein